MSDEDYSVYLKKQSYDDLVSISYSIDKEAHADRHQMVLAELAERDERGEKPEAKRNGKAACGVVLAVVSGVVGFVSTWLLGGLGICGFDLTAGMVCFALISGAVLPAVTVRLLPAPWWVSAVIFASLLPTIVFFQILGQEWNRVFASSGCIAIALVSAWIFRPRAQKVTHGAA